MSSEEEFKKWLNRPEKEILENFQFSIKVWRSGEFALTTKYEVILNYFVENCNAIWKSDEETNNFKNVKEFLNLKWPMPGIVNIKTKAVLVAAFIDNSKLWNNHPTRCISEILFQLAEHEYFQDNYKINYSNYCSLYGQIFQTYKTYLLIKTKGTNENCGEFSVIHESEYFGKVIKTFREFVKRMPEELVKKFGKKFALHTLQQFIEVTTILKSNNLKYFDDILEIEKVLFADYTETIFKKHLTYPIHVNLVNFECALINFRGNVAFYEQLFSIVFIKLPVTTEFSSPLLSLTMMSYFLDVALKYDVPLNFQIEEKPVLKVLSEIIENCVIEHKENNLHEVLCVLCSTIRFNPLILEYNIFKITTLILVTIKTHATKQKFEEFLILLMDMFKKLSRAEKMVSNLLNSIQQYLTVHKLSKTLKRKLKTEHELPTKIHKSENIDGSMEIQTIDEQNLNTIDVSNIYMMILLKDMNTTKLSSNIQQNSLYPVSFSYISFAWPSQVVGQAFSKFISNLMSKPSLVVCKTLIFSLTKHIETLKEATQDAGIITENLLFLVDIHAALLCEYFHGSRLAEQAHKFWKDIMANRILTRNLLTTFGKTILDLEHNNRTMNAFLEIAYYCGNFDLICWYYCPDSLAESTDRLELSKTIHDYLSQDEWILIEQRIVNFGKYECKLNMNRVCLQKVKTKLLMDDQKHELNVKEFLLSSTLSDAEQILTIFSDKSNIWLIQYLSKEQKHEICELMLMKSITNVDTKYLEIFLDFHECLEIILLNLYKKCGECFKSKNSILKSIDFTKLLECTDDSVKFNTLLSTINSKKQKSHITEYAEGELTSLLNLMKILPIGFTKIELKIMIFTLHLGLYRDLKATHNDKLIGVAFELLDDYLHFGQQIEIFKYFDIENLLQIFSISNSIKFYEFIFHTLRKTDGNAEKCLNKIIEILNEDHPQLSPNNLKLTLTVMEALSHQSNAKHFKSYLEQISTIYGSFIDNYFTDEERDPIADKKFVENTLQVYSIYINSILSKATKTPDQIDEKFRKICKIYIGNSIDSHNTYAIRLMNIVLNYRVQLHFDPDEVQFVLQKYWEQLKVDFKTDSHLLTSYRASTETGFIEESSIDAKQSDDKMKNFDATIKLIMMHKSAEEFRNILIEIGEDTSPENTYYICKILTKISQCQLTLIKGAILNEQFKKIIFEVVIKLEKDIPSNLFKNIKIVFNIVNSMKVICENQKIPMSPDHIDDILSFLIDINIKKFEITDTNTKLFKDLHQEMSELCSALIKYRHQIISDRIPHFIHIFKDLLQAICWYKSERQKDITLLPAEVDVLAELAQKLESLMHLIALRTADVKRLAPYMLTFAIHLMVTNKRPTTLYSKIKTHIESICYDLVSVCDHRVGSFILRNLNDASKNVYETLCKDYKKYHKFKGKV